MDLPMYPSTDMRVINLSNFPLEERHIKLLGSGLSSSPETPMDEFTVYKDINLVLCKAIFQVWHAGQRDTSLNDGSLPMTPEDKEKKLALESLISLLDEQIGSQNDPDSDKIKRPSDLYIKSTKMPPI